MRSDRRHGLDGQLRHSAADHPPRRSLLRRKVLSKPEKSSASDAELKAQVLPYVDDRAPLLSFVSRMLNKLIGERDWSAQEVSHILLRHQVHHSSRIPVPLDCRPEDAQPDLLVLESGDVTAQRSPLRRYRDRLADTAYGNPLLPLLSLYDCLLHWNWVFWKLRSRATPRVINYFPRYPDDPALATYPDYCRVRLMLHHPFVDCADLLSVDGRVYQSYVDDFRACVRLHQHPETSTWTPRPRPSSRPMARTTRVTTLSSVPLENTRLPTSRPLRVADTATTSPLPAPSTTWVLAPWTAPTIGLRTSPAVMSRPTSGRG